MEEPERHDRLQGVVMLREGTASGDGASQAHFGDRPGGRPGSEGVDVDLSCEVQFNPDAEGVEQAAIVVKEDPQVERLIGVDPGRRPQAEGEPFEVQPDEDPGPRQEETW